MQGRREVPAAELGAPLVHGGGGPPRGRRRGQWGQRVVARPVPPAAALRVSPRILNFKAVRLTGRPEIDQWPVMAAAKIVLVGWRWMTAARPVQLMDKVAGKNPPTMGQLWHRAANVFGLDSFSCGCQWLFYLHHLFSIGWLGSGVRRLPV